MEYNCTTDADRVGLLASSMNSVANVSGIGIEGAGNAIGVQGFCQSSSTQSQVEGTEGDSYGNGVYSVGVAGFSDWFTTAPSFSYGVYGRAVDGTVNYAIYSDGNMHVNGVLSKLSGTFKIDDPLDPDNKYLNHSFVESPDMMNIYNGNITTDANGYATVALPAYFDTLNKDFRYQLTVLGTFAQAIISKQVVANTFEIRTSLPNVDVSWQVTGVRKDPWANAHRVEAETEKESFNKGKYLAPRELGKAEDLLIGGGVKRRERNGAEMSKGGK